MRSILAGLALLAIASVAQAQEGTPRITVTGEGRVEATPDLASFAAGVQTEAARAEDAFAATAETMRAVFAALEAAGIGPADMQTSQLGVDPLWAEGEGQPRVRGYAASSTVTVRVRDLARLGAVVDAVTAAGANRLSGIAFEMAEPRAQLDASRQRAVADAAAKAELLAAAAGVRLGRVLSIREGGQDGPTPMFARAEMAMDMPVAQGVVALEARVEIVYALE